MSFRVVWRQPGEVTLEEFSPPPPGAGQVALAARLSLISTGTERAFLKGQPNTPMKFPQYPGYSVVGVVEALGPGVTHLALGQRVAYRAGHESHSLASAADCLPLPPEVPDEEAVFFEVLAMVSQGLHKVGIELGDSVALFGAGLMGALALKLLRTSGATPLVAFVRREARLDAALKAGADLAMLLEGSDPRQVFFSLTGDRGAAVTIDATDDPAVAVHACKAARTRGRVLLLGSVRGTTEINLYRDVHKKGLTLVGAHSSIAPAQESSRGFWTRNDERRLALRLLSSGRLRVADLVTSEFPWQEAPQAYRVVCGDEFSGVAARFRWRD